MCAPLWGAKNGILIIGLGMGYLVLYFAKREEKILQALGYILGTLMILYTGLCIYLNIIGIPAKKSSQRTIGPCQQRMVPSSQPVQPTR